MISYMTGIYEIRDLALKSGRAVYDAQQLSNLTGTSKEIAAVYLSRLVDKGLAKRVLRGKITFVDNDFVIASQLIEPSYISLDSALLFHNIITQVPRNVQSVTTINSMRFEDIGLEYHKIPGDLFFGFKRESIGGSYAFVASPEKSLIDGYYLNLYSIEELFEFSRELDYSDIWKSLNRFEGKGSKKLKEMVSLLMQTK